MTTTKKEQILEELHTGLQAISTAQRAVFSAISQLANLETEKAEAPATGQGGIAAFAAEHARKLTDGEASKELQIFLAADQKAVAPATSHLPLDNLSPQALARLGTPEVSEALRAAKGVLSDSLKKAGLPDHLLTLIDRVTPEDLYKVQKAAALPTSVDAPTEIVEEENTTLPAFIGPGSVFTRFLSHNVIFGGMGDLEPKVAGLGRFKEDIIWLEESVRRDWPTGFYLNRDTKVLQFMVNTDLAAFIVDGLPSEVAPVFVAIYGSKAKPRPIQEFSTSEQKLLFAKLVEGLMVIVKKKG